MPDYTSLNAKAQAVAHRLAYVTAAAVHRKRAPGLVLFVAPENADNGGEASHG